MEMEIDDAVLADLVRQFPELYDKGNENFKDKNIKQNAWETISSTLNVDVKSAQTRWNVLRNRFSVERKREKNVPSGSGAKKTWLLYSALSFLDNHIAMRKTIGNITAPTEPQPLASTSPWSSLNIMLEDDSMCGGTQEILSESSETLEQTLQENGKYEISTADKENNPNKQFSQQERINLFKNETPPLKKKRKKGEETNIMTKLSSAFDNFNDYLKKKENPKEIPPNLEHESIINFVKLVGNDLMQLKNKKILHSAEIEIMQVVKKALAEDMTDE
ncbi:hypothetical protein JTB14_011857 [Gonioctena quinquepunctata]|nr:hypothetical protein JTB14_011857 [Gonioctena quinquepunctata]